MEFKLSNLKTQNHNYFSPIFSTTKQPLTHWVPPHKKASGARIQCGKNTKLVVELERELDEIENQGRGWREMNKCKGGSSLVELLECLEREAIMGDDEGREPTDYNRRALIFDKSSKVFQALKELRNTSSTHV